MTTPQTAPSRTGRRAAAFTLIELLTVIAIIGVLVAILLPSLRRVRDAASVAQELSSARQLAQAYQVYADHHQGYVLPAKVHPTESPKPIIDDQPTDAQGDPVQSIASQRWFWRLAPYLDFNYEVFYRDEELLYSDFIQQSQAGFAYAVTVYPGFGINERFVGGLSDYYEPESNYTQAWGTGWWIERITDARRPSQLFVFVSSATVDSNGDFREGFFKVTAPYFVGPKWPYTGNSPIRDEASPGNTGNVWPVANQTVVTAMLDGHAEALKWDEAKDMRRWAPKADSADWHMSPP